MGFVRWEEKVISNDKGRRLVHYYLRDGEGKKTLAVVGREKSLRHMSYVVTVQFSAMMTAAAASLGYLSPSSALDFGVDGGRMKWKSRRELIDWLSSVVSDYVPCTSLPMCDRLADHDTTEPTTIQTSKDLSPGRIGHLSKEFSWLGPSWDCKKKRKHYQSFCRNGITISVHSFVYIMAEEYKRLVAYVEDLYEDMKASKMVVVRWFHKVDEVDDIVLPLDINDGEIFFSLALQDLSIECIDGLASVLSGQDFDKFQNEARDRPGCYQPYLCRRMFENDEVKSFDIKQVKGYWSQDVLRYLYATPGTSLKLRLKITHRGSQSSHNVDARGAFRDVNKSRGEKHANNLPGPRLLIKEVLKQNLVQQQKHLVPGSHVEVLSQDSGVRGCWFHCVVLKRHRDKVKVQYEDVQDADGTGNLEEWVLASRVASPDKLGIWSCGRQLVRPYPSQSSYNSSSLGLGSIVDAWWHDGWWEGIVISKELEGKFRIYFPGEQQDSVFSLGDLRPSQEWVSNKWNHIKDHQDIATSLLSTMDLKNRLELPCNKDPVQASETEAKADNPQSCSEQLPEVDKEAASIPNLNKICYLDSLKWSSSKKRRRARELCKGISKGKRQRSSGSSNSSSSGEDVEAAATNACSNFLLPKTLSVVDNDNCKIGGSDPMLVAPMALVSNLVMSQ